ncbi:MAG: tRNA 2-thiouridine(34) synthase MnmA [Abditibacteriota bacterium]|nr:tRNA 2-thiouridine(34) synthase MnmA [Abditibacteriota bacterium]
MKLTNNPKIKFKGNKQIIVLMSGGVDSSVTALMLKEKGYNVLGVTMKLPLANSNELSCNGNEAMEVAKQLDIPHCTVEVQDEFKDYVINPFREDYKEGRTPSPCVDCNRNIKFGLVWDFLRATFGINYLATGHYAKIYKYNNKYHLGRGRDRNRDQSYFLYGIKEENLKYLKFPLEPFTKDEVRQKALDYGLKIAQKPDSMELCFAGGNDYRKALEVTNIPGEIIDSSGKILGYHTGITNYTIGQRKGLGVSAPYPLYVLNINPLTNTVTLGKKEEGITNFVECHNINILEKSEAIEGLSCKGKIRSAGEPRNCFIESISKDYIKIVFENALFRPAPGQKCVLYNDKNNIILGGTII